MRLAIGFAFIVLLATGTSNAQELGVSVSGGYSIPGDGRLFFGSCSLRERDLRDQNGRSEGAMLSRPGIAGDSDWLQNRDSRQLSLQI